MALILKSNGDMINICPANKKFTFEELQEMVGGYVIVLHQEHDGVFLGREFDYAEQIQELHVPLNLQATQMYCRWKRDPTAMIHGDVVLVPNEEMD